MKLKVTTRGGTQLHEKINTIGPTKRKNTSGRVGEKKGFVPDVCTPYLYPRVAVLGRPCHVHAFDSNHSITTLLLKLGL